MGTSCRQAPNSVNIVYRRAGSVHVFTSPELKGFHVGDLDLKRAFDLIPEAVSGIVELTFGEALEYEPEESFDEFEHRLQSNDLMPVLKVKIGHHAHA